MRIIILLFCVFILGCKQTSKSLEQGAQVKFIPLKEASFVEDLAPFVDTLLYIEPECPLPSPLSKMLVDRDGGMYMLGFDGQMLALTSEGKKYKNLVGHGRANNEYVRVSDIALRQTPKELLVLDEDKVLVVGLDDSVVVKNFRIPDNIPFDGIAPAAEGHYWLFSAFPRSEDNYLLRLIDEEGRMLSKVLEGVDLTVSFMNITQSANNIYYLKPQSSEQIFYQLEQDSLIPRYEVDFGDKSIPERYYFDVTKNDMAQYMNAPYFKQLSFAHETKNHFYFKCAGENAVEYNFLMNKRKPYSGIAWINRDKSSDIYVIGADDRFLYVVFNKHQAEVYNDSKETNLLYRYIVQTIDTGVVFKDSDEVIVKLSFKNIIP